jgi:ferric enterobactin receptor
MKRNAFALALLALIVSVPVQAQNPAPRAPGGPPPSGPGEIRGRVLDAESSTPIASAAVAVRNAADSSLVAGTMVRQDGTFSIEGLRPGSYYLRLTMIGYTSQTTAPLAITAAAPRAMAGNIQLTRAAVEVAAVEANAERAVVISPDRNSYSVKQVAPAASNASEVLDNVPSVSVDADGKISLRGNENVVVQINGRPTPIRGDQLAGYLRQLPSNTIDRVEVVPNPSAKQDPEGMAGIINIVMKQGVDLGTSGGFTLSASTEDRYSVGGNIGHQVGKIAASANYGFFDDTRSMNGINDRTRLGFQSSPLSFTEQDLEGKEKFRGHNATANLDYTLNKKDVLSTTLQFNKRNAGNDALNFYQELNGSRTLLDEYDRLRDSQNDNLMFDGLVSFKHTIVPQKHELVIEARGNTQTEDDATDLIRQEVPGTSQSELERQRTDANTRQITGQVDYTRTLSAVLKLETGWKGYVRSIDRDFNVEKDALGNGNWVPSNQSNEMQLDESVNAAYAVLSKTGKKVDVQGGLRGEYATRDFELATTGEAFPHNYWSLFPSAIVNWKMNDKTQTKFSYSRRIRRPGTQELNPFPVFFDDANVFLGNAQLDPEYTDAFEIGYQRSGALGTLQVSPFYRYTSNIIRVDINTADTIANREVTTISFTNLDHSSSWGVDINGQFKLSQKISLMPAFNVFKMVTDGGTASALQSDAVMWGFRVNGTYNYSPSTSLLGNFFYRGPQTMENGKFAAIKSMNLTVRQKLSPKLTGLVRVSDPLKTQKFRVEVGDDNIKQLTMREFNSRALHITLQYNTGQTPRLRQRRQEEQQQGSSPFGS